MMNFALSGMLAIFLAALFTKRGNSATVIAALITGALVVLLFQDKITPLWTPVIFGHNQTIAWPWWMPIATPIAFLVCIAGKSRRR
jgi:Na+/proline symporter